LSRCRPAALTNTHTRPHAQVALSTADPAPGAAALAAALAPTAASLPPWLPALVAADAAAAAATIASSMAAVSPGGVPPPALAARLELVSATRCPRWHCDSVGLRALVTYGGPGTPATRYAPEPAVGARVVDRTDGCSRPAAGGDRVDASRAVEAAPGDIILLGGHLRGGGSGAGPYLAAVHQSPNVPPGVVRLLLTIDDAAPPVACGGCEAC